MTKTVVSFAMMGLCATACSREAPRANDSVVQQPPGATATAAPPSPPPVAPRASAAPEPDVQPAPKKERPGGSPGAGMPTGPAGSFDGAAAARALNAVDLSGCGATPGTSGHVTVTFTPDGNAKSEIDSGGPSGAAAACIRSRYDAVHIPSFDGTAPVKTGKSFFIKSDI